MRINLPFPSRSVNSHCWRAACLDINTQGGKAVEHLQLLPLSLGSPAPCSQFGDGILTPAVPESVASWMEAKPSRTGDAWLSFSMGWWRQHGDWSRGKMPSLPSSSSSSLAAGKCGLLFVIDLLVLAIVHCVLGLIG